MIKIYMESPSEASLLSCHPVERSQSWDLVSMLRQRSEGQAGLTIERESDIILGHQATLTRGCTFRAAVSLVPVVPQKSQET